MDSRSPPPASRPSASGWTSTAENLANAQTTRGANGQPYRRKEVILQEAPGSFGATLSAVMGGGAATPTAAACTSPASSRTRLRPSASTTRATRTPTREGYVSMPNVDTVSEMVDLISASRAYEANVTAMQAAKQMFSRTLELLR